MALCYKWLIRFQHLVSNEYDINNLQAVCPSNQVPYARVYLDGYLYLNTLGQMFSQVLLFSRPSPGLSKLICRNTRPDTDSRSINSRDRTNRRNCLPTSLLYPPLNNIVLTLLFSLFLLSSNSPHQPITIIVPPVFPNLSVNNSQWQFKSHMVWVIKTFTQNNGWPLKSTMFGAVNSILTHETMTSAEE
jgi:hypothetical protein